MSVESLHHRLPAQNGVTDHPASSNTEDMPVNVEDIDSAKELTKGSTTENSSESSSSFSRSELGWMGDILHQAFKTVYQRLVLFNFPTRYFRRMERALTLNGELSHADLDQMARLLSSMEDSGTYKFDASTVTNVATIISPATVTKVQFNWDKLVDEMMAEWKLMNGVFFCIFIFTLPLYLLSLGSSLHGYSIPPSVSNVLLMIIGMIMPICNHSSEIRKALVRMKRDGGIIWIQNEHIRLPDSTLLNIWVQMSLPAVWTVWLLIALIAAACPHFPRIALLPSRGIYLDLEIFRSAATSLRLPLVANVFGSYCLTYGEVSAGKFWHTVNWNAVGSPADDSESP